MCMLLCIRVCNVVLDHRTWEFLMITLDNMLWGNCCHYGWKQPIFRHAMTGSSHNRSTRATPHLSLPSIIAFLMTGTELNVYHLLIHTEYSIHVFRHAMTGSPHHKSTSATSMSLTSIIAFLMTVKGTELNVYHLLIYTVNVFRHAMTGSPQPEPLHIYVTNCFFDVCERDRTQCLSWSPQPEPCHIYVIAFYNCYFWWLWKGRTQRLSSPHTHSIQYI